MKQIKSKKFQQEVSVSTEYITDKEDPIEILELKNAIPKNSIVGFNSRMKHIKEQISELENRTIDYLI